MRYEIRPLGPWLEPVSTDRRGSHLFRAGWQSTLDLLMRETELLDAELVVLQIDVTDGDLRRDGMLRTNARVGFPGVRVAFESAYGPLTYSTDAYEQQYSRALPGWQANVRAVALALEALRAVDRYGVSGRGEQYRGWTAITARPAEMTPEQAAEFIAHWAFDARFSAPAILNDPVLRDRALKVAAARTHPDRTGDPDTFARLTAARAILDKAAS
jgi:hypothetical protein